MSPYHLECAQKIRMIRVCTMDQVENLLFNLTDYRLPRLLLVLKFIPYPLQCREICSNNNSNEIATKCNKKLSTYSQKLFKFNLPVIIIVMICMQFWVRVISRNAVFRRDYYNFCKQNKLASFVLIRAKDFAREE